MKASVGVMLFLLAGSPALAEPPDALQDEMTAPIVPEVLPADRVTLEAPAVDALVADTTIEDDGALSLDELADLRGGEAIVIQHTTQTLAALNTGNSVNADTVGSGAVNLGANAFNGYDGIGNFVINTGHNNNLQGSISVSIAMTPQ